MVDLDQGVESLSQNVQKVLMEMDIELYEASAVKFELETKREAQLAAAATEVPRVADWETVEQLAMRYLSESCTFIFASVKVPTLLGYPDNLETAIRKKDWDSCFQS